MHNMQGSLEKDKRICIRRSSMTPSRQHCNGNSKKNTERKVRRVKLQADLPLAKNTESNKKLPVSIHTCTYLQWKRKKINASILCLGRKKCKKWIYEIQKSEIVNIFSSFNKNYLSLKR